MRFALPVAALLVVLGCGSADERPSGSGGSAGTSGLGGGLGAAGNAGEAGAKSGAEAGAGGVADAGEAGAGGVADAGAGGEAGAEVVPEIPIVDEHDLAEPADDVGFVELEPHTFDDVLTSQKAATSSRTRLFYHLLAADADAKNKPVLVFFNGGPGYTSMLLHSFGTGRLTLNADAPDELPVANSSSFTTLGSVLYIDARHTGFSYGVASDAPDSAERARAFEKSSFNPSADAADFIRVLLRVLKKQPALVNNQIVLVGESYGGTRATLMLELLLRQPNPLYSDPDLASEIAAHYQEVFVGIAPSSFTPQLFAKQFGWQVLIQPILAGSIQMAEEGMQQPAIEARMAAALGVDVETLRANCKDNRSRPQSWCDAIDRAITRTLLDPDSFARWMGSAPEAVNALPASQRAGGFRFVNTTPSDAEPAAWIARAGALPAWDRYFSAFRGESVPGSPYALVTSGTPMYAYPFVGSVRSANTLITNAAFDANLPEEVLVPSLRKLIQQYPMIARTLSKVDYMGSDPDAPSERIKLSFIASPELGRATQRTVYFPSYASSGHMVTTSEPAKFQRDVSAFLSETGIATVLR